VSASKQKISGVFLETSIDAD